MGRRAAADRQMAVVQPAARRFRPAADRGLGRLRQRRALLCVSLRRRRAVPDQDVDHQARQHLERRLGRLQPRRARNRADLVPPAGQSERHPARHAQHRRRRRRHLARLGLAERRARDRDRLRGRDSSPAAIDPPQGRRRRADGRPVLAPHQPCRRIGLLAGARAGQVGVPEAREAGVHRHHRPADPRGDSVRDVLARPGTLPAQRVGRCRQPGGSSASA